MAATDGELIQKIAQNDTKAFDLLFSRHKDAVYRFAFYLTQNRMEADDLFQETWLRVVKYLPSTGDIRDFRAWVLTITANLHRDELRKRKLRRLFFLQSNKNLDPEFNELEKADSFNLARTKDESRQVDANLALKKAIASLSLKQRKVFILKEIEGLKHAEISEIMKLPVGTVKSLLHRAIKKMQHELSDFLVD